MSARVSYTEVQEILDTTVAADKIEAFIEAANAWIDANLQGVCTELSDAMLTQIEKFLAAHFVSTTVAPALVSASRGDISETYARGSATGSEYLTTAAAMDPCGIIAAAFMGKPRFRFKVGTTYTAEA